MCGIGEPGGLGEGVGRGCDTLTPLNSEMPGVGAGKGSGSSWARVSTPWMQADGEGHSGL